MEIYHKNSLPSTVQSLLAEALQIPLVKVSADLAYGDLPQWDSMGHMEIMMILEQHFDIQIEGDKFAILVNVPAIVAYLSAIPSIENNNV